MNELTDLLTGPLAIEPSAIGELVAGRGAADPMNWGGGPKSWYKVGNVAVVPVVGYLAKVGAVDDRGRPLATTYSSILEGFKSAVADRETSFVVLHIGSQGGQAVGGLYHLADEIYGARKQKPSIALAEDTACSAAYLLASAASMVVLGDNTTRVGSIGVIQRHIDESQALEAAGLAVTTLYVGARKADAIPEKPLSPAGRARIMGELEGCYREFVDRVAKFRGLTIEAVRATEAAVFQGADAVRVKLADAVEAPAALLARLASSSSKGNSDMMRLSLPGATGAGVSAPLLTPGAVPAVVDASYIQQVQAFGRQYNAGADLVLNAINSGKPLGEVQSYFEGMAAALDRQANGQAAAAMVADAVQPAAPFDPSSFHHGSPDQRRAMMAEALAYRLRPGAAPSAAAREYLGASLADIAGELLNVRGVGGRRRSAADTISAALSHTAGDFPALLADAGHRSLITSYEAAPPALRAVARKVTAKNYKPLSRITLGEHPELKKLPASGKLDYGTVAEASEKFRVHPFGRLFALSREAMVNDDLGAFSDWIGQMSAAATELEANELAALLLANGGAGPKMEDGHFLFDAAIHRNAAAAGALITDDALSDARLSMRTQKGVDGKTPVQVIPRFLVVGPMLETVAERYLAQLNATKAADVNPFAGKLELVVEARIPDRSWYVFGDPAVRAALEYAYLNDAGPALEAAEGWTTLGMEMRVTHDFGCGAVDWRPAYRNEGPAN